MSLSKTKAGILLATLVIPASVFIFLKVFGRNHFDLPYYFPKIDNTTGEIVKSGEDTVFHQIEGIKLIDAENLEVNTNSSKIRIFSLFFSRCGTICPTTNRNLNRVAEIVPQSQKFDIYSITVDPVFDTYSSLKEYKRKNSFNKPNHFFLTGDKQTIYNFAIKQLKIPAADASEYDKDIKDVDETFIHSDKLLLIDKKGYCRGIYSGTDRHEVDRLIVELKVLLSQNERINKNN